MDKGEKGRAAARSRSRDSRAAPEGSVKAKSTKSRNGCVTCKAKRLKCDETKPSCLHCKKRNVTCGGYKKDFKWKTFEESSFARPRGRPKESTDQTEESNDVDILDSAFSTPIAPADSLRSGATVTKAPLKSLPMPTRDPSPYHSGLTPNYEAFALGSNVASSYFPSDNSVSSSPPPTYNALGMAYPISYDGFVPPSAIQGVTPGLVRSGMIPSSFASPVSQDSGPWQESPVLSNFEAIQSPHSISSFSARSIQSMSSMPADSRTSQMESLMYTFVSDTCEVLSMERGRDNPWRKYMLPMAQSCPSLLHAIVALTAFRASSQRPEIKASAIEHKAEALRHLSSDMPHLSATQALASTLALTIAEAFDTSQNMLQQYSSMSRPLVTRILEEIRQGALSIEQLRQSSYVVNAWLYMDVMTSLTSKIHAFDTDLATDALALTSSLGWSPPIDPCMGIATSLFPLLGQVANLLRVARDMQTNDANVMAEAERLKTLLAGLGPRHAVPEDVLEGDVADFENTAEAYRRAALLLLNQAVPENAFKSSSRMAERILVLLSSRWQEFNAALQVGIGARCMDVTREVWRRRDDSTTAVSATDVTTALSTDLCHETSAPTLEFGAEYVQQRTDDHYASSTSEGVPSRTMQRHRAARDSQTQEDFSREEEMLRIFEGAAEFDLSGPPLEAARPVIRPRAPRTTSPETETEDQMPYQHSIRGQNNWLAVMDEWGWDIWLA